MRKYLFQSDRIGFSRWGEKDLPLARTLWGDPAVTRYISRTGHFTQEQIEDRLRTEIENDRQYGVQYWPLFLLETGDFIGCCGLRPHDLPEGVYEFGIHLLPACHGRGLASEAGRAVVQYAGERPDIRALFAGHHPENAASRKLLGRIGFVFVRDDFYAPTGLMHPSYRYDL